MSNVQQQVLIPTERSGVAALLGEGQAGHAGIRLPRPRTSLALLAGAASSWLVYEVGSRFGLQQAVLLIIGLLLGLALYHARFGFTSAFRQLVAVGQGAGLRAHMIMLAVASVLFAGILSSGVGLFGVEPAASLAPLGPSLLFGAFLFGVGMQLGGACASGTLYTIGGGHAATVLTLIGFIAGSVLGAWHWGFWTQELPSLPPVSLAQSRLGFAGAAAVQLAVFALIIWATVVLERRRRPPAPEQPPRASGPARILRGSWPLWVGAIVLALLNAATLLTRGEPWGITSAFALWGSKIAGALGVDVDSWAYWSGERAASLGAPLLSDATTVMNFGIVLGAFFAATVAGTFVWQRRIPPKTVLASLLGGVMMGYGARLAYGCNVGAYFSGIASFSLHGWIWGALALAGTYVGIKLRPMFGLRVPKPSDSTC